MAQLRLEPGEALQFLLDSIQGGGCEALELLKLKSDAKIEMVFEKGDGWEILEGFAHLPALEHVVKAAIGDEEESPVAEATESPLPSHREGLVVKGIAVKDLVSNDVSGVAYTDSDLRNLFAALDKNNNGYLETPEFKQFYSTLETFGTEPDPAFVDSILKQVI
eukprot:TRINITY_DN426_c1_g1_i4.p1 TRINITY_DN426_c1_g1~~TRINITY_DN426_c1_g1_i4.p1  ORF type:complete len:164 (+),score=28.95 TRINITY_DN426_c1_g1_i4:226-717(+)